MNERNDKLDGPYRVADVKTVWLRIGRMVDHLHKLSLVKRSAAQLYGELESLEKLDKPDIDDGDLNYTLAMLAVPDGMCASDWLRMKVVDARGQTNTPLHALDLRGFVGRRLVIRFDPKTDEYRVTVQNLRGDVASVASPQLGNALSGAVRMAGARKDTP